MIPFIECGISLEGKEMGRRARVTRRSSEDFEFSTISSWNRKSESNSSEDKTISKKRAAQSELPRTTRTRGKATPKSSESETISKKPTARTEVPKKPRTSGSEPPLGFMDDRSLDEWMSGFRPTLDTTSLQESSQAQNASRNSDLKSLGKYFTWLN